MRDKKGDIKKEVLIKEPKPDSTILDYIWYYMKIFFATIMSVVGTFSWLLKAIVVVICTMLISAIIVCSVGYVKIKPTLDECREIAYDKLAQMKKTDFSMLSDTEVYDKDGNLLGLINAGHYEYVSIDKINLSIQNAYIAQEDRRFKSHSGVDFLATMRAGLALIKHNGEITQGASTITQQVIKNTYLSQEQTFTRKITEILLAPQVEKKYSKADIMEFYCNTNFYGNRCYGVQAASRYYFGKNAEDIEVWEAATLAGLSNSPSKYDPIKHPTEAFDKRNSVLKSMLEVEFITQDEYSHAIEQPLGIVQETQEGTDENYMVSYAIHCAALELMKLDGFEFKYTFVDRDDYLSYDDKYKEAYAEKSDEIRSGGYKIYTSLDVSMQEQLQNAIDKGLSRYTELQENGKYALQGASVIVDNQTGYIVAIVGGRGTDDQFNRAYLSARQPGSTIKPLIDYAPAFDTGEYYPSKIMNDHKWEDGPSNSGSYYGNVTLREALNRSLNTVAWQILQGIGVDKGLSYLGKMHFQKITYVDNGVESLSIGGFTNGLRVVDMAKGYSTLANNGVYNDKTCIVSLIDRTNKDVVSNMRTQTVNVYTEDTAYMITDILKGTLTEPFGTGRGLSLANGQLAAGKTGTTNSNKDTWFCGYTKYYTTAVWVGYDTPRPMPGVFGATYAGSIWKNAMDSIHIGLEPLDWEQPETVITCDYNPVNGEKSSVETGVSDLFSTTGELLAEQTAYERSQKELALSIEVKVNEYDNWNITTVEDTYLIESKTSEIKGLVSTIQEDELREPLMERVQDKYTDLKAIERNMSDTIKLYEHQKELEEKESQAQAESIAEEQRKQLEYETKIKDYNTALNNIKNLKYQSDNAENLVWIAENKLQELIDDVDYETYKNELETAIENIKTLPTKDEWDRLEAERIKREEEERIKREQEQQAEIERQEKEIQEKLNQEKQSWNKEEAKGPGYINNGPGASSNSSSESNGPNSNNSTIQRGGY